MTKAQRQHAATATGSLRKTSSATLSRVPLLLQVLKTGDDLKTSACCTAKAPPRSIRDILKRVPQEVKDKYYGCGSPIPLGIDGLR